MTAPLPSWHFPSRSFRPRSPTTAPELEPRPPAPRGSPAVEPTPPGLVSSASSWGPLTHPPWVIRLPRSCLNNKEGVSGDAQIRLRIPHRNQTRIRRARKSLSRKQLRISNGLGSGRIPDRSGRDWARNQREDLLQWGRSGPPPHYLPEVPIKDHHHRNPSRLPGKVFVHEIRILVPEEDPYLYFRKGLYQPGEVGDGVRTIPTPPLREDRPGFARAPEDTTGEPAGAPPSR